MAQSEEDKQRKIMARIVRERKKHNDESGDHEDD